MRVRLRTLVLALVMAAAISGCGEVRRPTPGPTVTIKLPPAKPASIEPGFSAEARPVR